MDLRSYCGIWENYYISYMIQNLAMAMGNNARVELEDPRPGLVHKWKRLLKLEAI